MSRKPYIPPSFIVVIDLLGFARSEHPCAYVVDAQNEYWRWETAQY